MPADLPTTAAPVAAAIVPAAERIEGGVWRHDKGELYRVILRARAASDGVAIVVYQDIGTGRIYTRSEGEWQERVLNCWGEGEGDRRQQLRVLPRDAGAVRARGHDAGHGSGQGGDAAERVFATTRDIAAVFGKQHKHVLMAVRTIMDNAEATAARSAG
jgi:hypothetical protein